MTLTERGQAREGRDVFGVGSPETRLGWRADVVDISCGRHGVTMRRRSEFEKGRPVGYTVLFRSGVWRDEDDGPLAGTVVGLESKVERVCSCAGEWEPTCRMNNRGGGVEGAIVVLVS